MSSPQKTTMFGSSVFGMASPPRAPGDVDL
jgi:hypothetical protein